jgi:hypothetical protein
MNVKTVNIDSQMQALADTHQRVAVGVAAASLGALPANCSHVFFSVDTQPIRITLDGTTPTSTIGHYLSVGEKFTLKKSQAVALQFIRAGGADGAIQATPMAH